MISFSIVSFIFAKRMRINYLVILVACVPFAFYVLTLFWTVCHLCLGAYSKSCCSNISIQFQIWYPDVGSCATSVLSKYLYAYYKIKRQCCAKYHIILLSSSYSRPVLLHHPSYSCNVSRGYTIMWIYPIVYEERKHLF